MPGATLDWKTDKIALNPGQLYANAAIPAAGAAITLDAATGRPDTTANPGIIHLGATKAGAKIKVAPKYQGYKVDEFRADIARSVDDLQMMFSAEMVGVTDSTLLELLLPGVGTKSTGTGYERVTIGAKPLTYTSFLHVFPSFEDPTKFCWWQIYRGGNDAGIEYAIGRTELGFTPLNVLGYEITSRAIGDTIGQFNKQVA